MSRKLQLTIAEPCQEKWDSMSPVEKGKFCGSCQKQVIDFSDMGDREIAIFFKKPSTGSVCGRFMADQLDRTINIPTKRIPWFKYFFSIMLPAVFLSKASGQSTSKSIAPSTTDTARIPVNHEYRTMGLVMPTQIIPVYDTIKHQANGKVVNAEVPKMNIQGIILHNETRKPVESASIYLVGEQRSVFPDKYGRFNIKLNKGDVIIVSATGMDDQEIVIGNERKVIVRLKESVIPFIAGKIAVKRS